MPYVYIYIYIYSFHSLDCLLSVFFDDYMSKLFPECMHALFDAHTPTFPTVNI